MRLRRRLRFFHQLRVELPLPQRLSSRDEKIIIETARPTKCTMETNQVGGDCGSSYHGMSPSLRLLPEA